MATVLTLLILSAVAVYLMKPEERVRLARNGLAAAGRATAAATSPFPPGDPLDAALRARTPWVFVTPLLVALNVLIFTFMLFSSGPLADPQTLVSWGGNFAPRTTNGEWWRVLTSTFVHRSLLHLLATIAGLVPLGLILERAVGRVAFATVYLAAGMLASVVSLRTASAVSVSAGASGALFGLYGLLLASLLWSLVSRAAVSMPLITLKRVGASASVFFLYNLVTDDLGTTSELAGLTAGFVSGLVVARGVMRDKPPARRAVLVMAAAVLIAAVCAAPVRGLVDVRPELARIVELEERTAGAYDAAVVEFRRGRITSRALVRLIDRTIVPELQAARAHLTALSGVPREQAPLVAAAGEYFRLREQSWRRRAEGLVKVDMRMLREADETERGALEAWQKIRPVG